MKPSLMITPTNKQLKQFRKFKQWCLLSDFGTSLGCAAAATAPCSLANSPRQILELTCICVGHLCNAPFALELRNELLNFSSDNNSALAEAFFKLSKFANVSDAALYKAITVEIEVNSTMTTEAGSLSVMPKAEALKQQTAPSDDEEDESEGSGAYEDSKLHTQGQSASAPAAPSSYLPAENTACSLTIILAPLAFIHLMF